MSSSLHSLRCVCAVASLFVAFCASAQQVTHSPEPQAPHSPEHLKALANSAQARHPIQVDLPLRVRQGVPFQIDVWLDPASPDDNAVYTIYAEQSDTVQYEPKSVTVRPKERKSFTAKVVNSPSGLAQINFWCDGCVEYFFNVDAQFAAKLKLDNDQALQSGTEYPVSLDFVNAQGTPLQIDAPVDILVRSGNAQMRPLKTGPSGANPNSDWTNELTISVVTGVNSTPMFSLKPNGVSGREVSLTAIISPHGNPNVSFTQPKITVNVLPRWWFTLLLAVLGGCIPPLLHWVAQFDQNRGRHKLRWAKFLSKLFAGAFAGLVAYLFADWDIIGVKLDTSSPRTFIILGFLFAYVGVDVLIRKILPSDEQNDEAHNTTHRGPRPAHPDPGEPHASAATPGGRS